MQVDVKSWRELFLEKCRESDDVVRGYLAFVERCAARDLPPLFEERHLSKLIGLSFSKLEKLLSEPSAYYRTFSIPKRLGGRREINVPSPLLLAVQQWILSEILYKLPVGEFAHGGVPGRSIVSNAKVHLGAASILRMDLQDFFGSIETAAGSELFRDAGYPPNICRALSMLCFHDDRLPQGAATSPAVANLVSFNLDMRLSGLAEGFGLKYSRYFDDITFSGKHIGLRFPEIVKEIISETRFVLNADKTVLIRGRSPKFVTGISVGGDRLRVPREYRRALKNQAFYILKRGIDAHSASLSYRNPLAVERVLGRLAFWLHVEPESKTAKDLFVSINEYRRKLNGSDVLPNSLRPIPFTIDGHNSQVDERLQ